MPILASGNGHEEAVRMVSEKIDAAVRGSLDASVAASALFGRAATGRLNADELPEGLLRVGQAALAPAYQQVHANARRLSRR
ncbi:hypothetical protein [Blastochloris viridis]|nr:hypothetical protein [Blastochloris viridis]